MTETVKHTPGEWFWSGNTLMANHTDHPKFVCDVDGASIADKVLIAAAPEMLAVCEWLVRVHSAFMADDHPLMVAARAAFAKAEGRQS